MSPEIGEYYKHRYGGIYAVRSVAESTVDNTEWVVYEHIYPFEQKLWTRPMSQWADGRFTKISRAQLEEELSKDRGVFSEEITMNKKIYKGH